MLVPIRMNVNCQLRLSKLTVTSFTHLSPEFDTWLWKTKTKAFETDGDVVTFALQRFDT